jgi:hypothetical protein
MPAQGANPSRPAARSRGKRRPAEVPPATPEPAAGSARKGPRESKFRARIRMYRQGLGDCFLVTIPRAGGDGAEGKFFVLIDCGVILGTPDAKARMTAVVEDVVATTGGTIDLLLATHEHWDHLSGFVQAGEAFSKLKVREVWMAWTEDPTDDLAAKLHGERDAAVAALRLSANRMRLVGDDDGADEITGLLEFFGASRAASTKDALDAVRGLTTAPTYCRPGMKPFAPADLGGVRFYVLGPPRDEQSIRQTLPSKRDPETYGVALSLFLDNVRPGLAEEDSAQPFSSLYAVPAQVARETDFFKARYWGNDEWRRIETAWLDASAELALQLDSMTNNTSLVVAIELADREVLLFAADAQVGNWLSWQDLEWTDSDGRKVSGPELLKRTIFYKVGHHGSHNATLREKGLEMMGGLRVAMIPVDHEMALKKRWGKMPLPELVEALEAKTGGFVFRSDHAAPQGRPYSVLEKDLYFEVVL